MEMCLIRRLLPRIVRTKLSHRGVKPPESGKGAESSGDRSESSQTLSLPLSTTSSKSKKRAREDDEELSSASKHPEASTKSHSDAGYDFFGNVIGISE